MTNVREKLAWSLVAALGLLIAASLAGVVRGGPLDPPGAPVSTPGGIDGRIPINSLPFTIDAPASYVVTNDLQSDGGSGITVDADDVTIDLNGFTLDGVDKSGVGIAAAGRSNLSVVNGAILRWSVGLNNDLVSGNEIGGRFHGLQIDDNVFGVFLPNGTRVDAVIVRSNVAGIVSNGHGITVMESTFANNGTAIVSNGQDNLIESNHIEIPAGGVGIEAGDLMTVRRNFFGNPSLSGYVTIALGTRNYVVVIENRMKASLTTGGGGVGNVIIYDVTHPLTNISP